MSDDRKGSQIPTVITTPDGDEIIRLTDKNGDDAAMTLTELKVLVAAA